MSSRVPASSGERQIIRQKLSDQVFDRLCQMIRSKELAPGDAMPSERALMERFGVGRPAVREALQQLHTKGLITISHGERSRVNVLTAGSALEQVDEIARLLISSEPENLGHLKQLRQLLELGTIRLAAATAQPSDIAELRELAARQRASIGGDDWNAFIKTDVAFHSRIAKCTGNPLITAVTSAMLTWLFEYHTPLLHWSGREETTLAEHDALIDRLEHHDADGAAALMERHLSRSAALYRVPEA
ncbi:transcriptional regulator NanR [Acidimangrovimonas sediminis]|uniref:transcriptional regulator NanR n=1 Tax=Acidimangrovimonas sediminis TaxID=2056283 RepID=UPI000C80FCC9|nr:transcriptional regulator NanR [Acidimangrovimonas sediminis]